MFTGLVAAVGRVERHDVREDGSRVHIAAPLGALALGESISVSGACLTVAASTASSFEADLSRETLARTTLGRIGPGASVNLERAAQLGDRLGGHLVTGHVDGLARVLRVEAAGEARHVELEVPAELARFIAEKGSVALDGVSLTVNRVKKNRFEIMLIPHTLAVTTLGSLAPGRELNLEVDLVARYVARLLDAGAERSEAVPSAAALRGAV
ncbi:MAG TPA: riboflavin synthase [Polyangiaceae bacterium]|nr:riboflavin synthase [Polyangiaceae bacterium]